MPPSEGYLPYYLLLTSTLAIIHSAACYLSPPSASLRQFSGSQRPLPTALNAHVYAVKNVYTAAIRGYAAFHIQNQALYDLAILSFVGVLWLFDTELWIWRTVRYKEAVFPFTTAGTGLVWLVSQRAYYLRE